MRLIAVLALSLALISGVAITHAQEEPQEMENVTLLTAQDLDFLVASSVSNNFQLPLMLTDSEELSEEALMQIEQIQPSEVIVIGGPEAVSDEVVQQVEDHELVEEVTQVYGETASETSVAVSQMFWDEAEEAVVVHGQPDQTAITEIAETQVEGPVLLSMAEPVPEEMPEEEPAPEEENMTEDDEAVPEEETPPEPNETEEQTQLEENETQDEIEEPVLEEIERLGVQNVVLYTADEAVAEQLEEQGLNVETEEMPEEEPEEQPEEEENENGLLEELEEEFDEAFNGDEQPEE